MNGRAKESCWTSWLNGVESKEGGSHHDAVQGALERYGWTPKEIYIHLIGLEYRYAGPSKDRVIAPHLVEPLTSAILHELQQSKL